MKNKRFYQIKKMNYFLILLSFFLGTPKLFGGVKNSAHDFKTPSYVNRHLCDLCHTPHYWTPYDREIKEDMLWDREVDNDVSVDDMNKGLFKDENKCDDNNYNYFFCRNKFCLACHDGILAEFKGNASPFPMFHKTFPGELLYDTQTSYQNENLFDPLKQITFLGETIENDLLYYDNWSDNGNKMNCASCHNVHSGNLLRIDNTNNGLCLTCHKQMPE